MVRKLVSVHDYYWVILHVFFYIYVLSRCSGKCEWGSVLTCFVLLDAHRKWCEIKWASVCSRTPPPLQLRCSSTSAEGLGRKLHVPRLRSQCSKLDLEAEKTFTLTSFNILLNKRSWTSLLVSPCADGSRYGSRRNSRTGWCESLLRGIKKKRSQSVCGRPN